MCQPPGLNCQFIFVLNFYQYFVKNVDNYLIINALYKISIFNKCRKDFLCEAFVLLLSIKGRINFLQLGRFGKFKEQRYRQQFEKPFPFLDFNKELALSHGGKRFAIAFDPSYISKSGKKTPGLGWYWPGCAGQAKWGLEIGGLAAIDLDNHTAFHLEAVQTLIEDKQATVYLAVVYSKALKRNIRLVHVNYASDKGKLTRKLYFSTDTQMDALEILDCYQSRFQIEFLYRDAKQHTGLNDSQARSENKLNFHFNAALTAINIAKVEHWLGQPKETRKPFSIADIKTMNHNRLLLQRCIDVFGVHAYSAKNRNHSKIIRND